MSKLGGTNVSEDTDKDASGHLQSVVAGTGIDNIDSSDPVNPVINATPVVTSISGAKITQSGTQSGIGTATTRVEWDTEEYDDDSFADLVSDNERFTIPAGVTRVNVSAYISGTAMTSGNDIRFAIQKYNSSDVFQETSLSARFVTNASGQASAAGAVLGINVVAGDYIVVTVNHNDASWQINDAHAVIQDAS